MTKENKDSRLLAECKENIEKYKESISRCKRLLENDSFGKPESAEELESHLKYQEYKLAELISDIALGEVPLARKYLRKRLSQNNGNQFYEVANHIRIAATDLLDALEYQEKIDQKSISLLTTKLK
jgi:hypothetical protein